MIRAALFCLAALPAQAQTCLPYPWSEAATAAETLDLLDLTAPSLKSAADSLQPTLCLTDTQTDAHGTYDPDTQKITLKAALTPGQTAAILIHELRHLDQNRTGSCLPPDLTMRAHARATFALEADAMAITALVTWSLRDLDDGRAFAAFADLPTSADIAEEFATTVSATGDLAAATSAAFTAWYDAPERVERYYVDICETYLSRQETLKSLSGTRPFDPGLLTEICLLPDGNSYPCAEPENALPR